MTYTPVLERDTAVTSIGHIGKAAPEAALSALDFLCTSGVTPSEREATLEALGHILQRTLPNHAGVLTSAVEDADTLVDTGYDFLDRIGAGLQSESPSVRAQALTAIGSLGKQDRSLASHYLSAIHEGLTDDDLTVRESAADAIIAIEPRNLSNPNRLAEPLLDGLDDGLGSAATALGSLGASHPSLSSEIVDPLCTAIEQHEDSTVVATPVPPAAEALTQLSYNSEDTREHVLNFLRDELDGPKEVDHKQVVIAATLLTFRRYLDSEVVEQIFAVFDAGLSSSSPQLRKWTIEYLSLAAEEGLVPSNRYRDTVRTHLNSVPDLKTRIQACNIVGQFEDEGSVSTLCDFTSKIYFPDRRIAACRALGHIRTRRAQDRLEAILDEPDHHDVHTAAKAALDRLGTSPLQEKAARLRAKAEKHPDDVSEEEILALIERLDGQLPAARRSPSK